MSTSPTSTLSRPAAGEPIPSGTLAYLRARNRYRLYDLVVGEFRRSGLSQAELARRMGKRTDVVCRWLAGPGNWTVDTVSDLLFAISGAVADYKLEYPLDEPNRHPERSISDDRGAPPGSTGSGRAARSA